MKPPRAWTILLLAMAAARPLDAQQRDGAYLDPQAEAMLRLARLRRTTVDERIEAYSATVRERRTVDLRLAVGGGHVLSADLDRMLFRQEAAARIEWRRGGAVRIQVLGAREDAPLLSPVAAVPFNRMVNYHGLAYDPVRPDAMLLFDSTVVRHPLAEGSEAYYRFAAGDSARMRLPDGRVVRLRELRIIPRLRDPHLIGGSFWLDADTHALVKAYFKLARRYDADVDARDLPALAQFLGITTENGEESSVRVPGMLKPIRAELDFVAVEYGLADARWWLPRQVVWRGLLQVGRVSFPIRYEREYAGYQVRGDTTDAPMASRDSAARPCRPRLRFVSSLGDSATADKARQARADTIRARRLRVEALAASRRGYAPGAGVQPECAREVILTAARDSVLLSSPDLPSRIGRGFDLIDGDELRQIRSVLASVPEPPWRSPPPRFQSPLGGVGLARYNRVEGLSLGVRVSHSPTPSSEVMAEARLGAADLEPRGEVALERRGNRLETRTAAYRRLASMTGTPATHGTIKSIQALLWGRDDEDYFDALGGELVLRPPSVRPQWYQLRLYAERQRPVQVHTNLSVARLFDADHTMRENVVADPAQQFGAQVRLRAGIGREARKPSLGLEMSLTGEMGDFRFARSEALVRMRTPVLPRLAFGLEAAGGAVQGAGAPAQQTLFRLGNAATLRGYDDGVLVGSRYWRGRSEVGREFRGFSLVGFSDAGWAGSGRFGTRGALFSAGIGMSQGALLRVDLGRGLGRSGRWRLQLQVNGIM